MYQYAANALLINDDKLLIVCLSKYQENFLLSQFYRA
jgi:hypothetical protein